MHKIDKELFATAYVRVLIEAYALEAGVNYTTMLDRFDRANYIEYLFEHSDEMNNEKVSMYDKVRKVLKHFEKYEAVRSV